MLVTVLLLVLVPTRADAGPTAVLPPPTAAATMVSTLCSTLCAAGPRKRCRHCAAALLVAVELPTALGKQSMQVSQRPHDPAWCVTWAAALSVNIDRTKGPEQGQRDTRAKVPRTSVTGRERAIAFATDGLRMPAHPTRASQAVERHLQQPHGQLQASTSH